MCVHVYRTTYRDKLNRDVTDLLVKEVRSHNPTFLAADIRGTCTCMLIVLSWYSTPVNTVGCLDLCHTAPFVYYIHVHVDNVISVSISGIITFFFFMYMYV